MTTPRNDARIVIENIEKVEVAPDMRKPADAGDREAGEGDGVPERAGRPADMHL